LAGVGKDRRSFASLDPEAAGAWLGRCASASVAVEARLRQELEVQALLAVYEKLELPLVPVLADMERTGIRVDPAQLRALGAELEADMARHLAAVFAAAGHELNVASPKQLAQV